MRLLLVGRAGELAVVAGLLDLEGGHGAALVVSGAPGVGKSALLAEACGRAAGRGVRVLRCAAVRSETQLTFAGLEQILRPVMAQVDVLAAGHRVALQAALGVVDAPAPDRFRIALAALELLTVSAAQQPILVAVDDVQWLDRSTIEVLAFVARRLADDPVAAMATCRDTAGGGNPPELAGLPVLELAGLDPGAAADLLDAHAPGLAPEARQRLLEEAAGNPLALIELPLLFRASDLGMIPRVLPLTGRLEEAFADRFDALPVPARVALLVAAVADSDSLAEVLAAACVAMGTPVAVGDLLPAVNAQVVEIDGSAIRFRHPLIRSAVHQRADVAERNKAHAALAEMLAAEPDRAVWHAALASTGPDEVIAARLEAAAGRANARGAAAAAAAALERAALLSPDPRRRTGRLLRAGEAAFDCGQQDTAQRLLSDIAGAQASPAEQARIAWLHELLDGGWSGADHVAAFANIADRLRRGGEPDRAWDALLAVGLRCWWSDPDGNAADLVLPVAERLEPAADDPRWIALRALVTPIASGRALLARLDPARASAHTPDQFHLLGAAANAIGAYDKALDFLAGAAAGLRAQGRLGLLVQVLMVQAWAGVQVGRPDIAVTAAAESERLATETGQPVRAIVAQLAAATMAGRRGDIGAVATITAAAEQLLLPVGANPMRAMVHVARGTSALATGDHTGAYEILGRLFDTGDPTYQPLVRTWVVADYIEAAVRTGHADTARAVMLALEDLLAETASPVLEIGLLVARPLVASETGAERIFRHGLRQDLAAWPFQRARLLLGYGAWLRRQRRVAESRAILRDARDAFDALGAVAWAQHARQELRAAGEASPEHQPSAAERLTPQEWQIAQLAAGGLTNREIAERLYLSRRTVSTHLYHIFPKLGIVSRTELGSAITPYRPPSS